MPDDALGCAVLAAIPMLAMLVLRLREPLDADEGYLWYGVRQLLRGRMPHRDFKSYEPARYVWCALFVGPAGGGLWSLRLATHLSFAVGLAIALLALRLLGVPWLAVAALAAALASWTFPQYKQTEPAYLMLAWASQAWMLAVPGVASFSVAFAVWGGGVLLGFNLFLYVGAALALDLVLALALGWLEPATIPVGASSAAFVLATVPFLLLLASPGFARRFWQRRVISVFGRGHANLPHPMPWPWRDAPRQLPDDGWRRAFQWLFLAVFVLPIIGIAVAMSGALTRPIAAGVIAAAALAAFSAHHAASRADREHIALPIEPMIIMCGLLAVSWAGAIGATCIAGAFLWMAWPLWRASSRPVGGEELRRIGGLRIRVPPWTLALLEAASELCAGRELQRGGLYAAPAYPHLYAILGRDSPTYDTYSLYPSDADTQAAMISELERAGLFAALVCDAPTDGREELRFSRTHPLVWAFLHQRLRAVPLPAAGGDTFAFSSPP